MRLPTLILCTLTAACGTTNYTEHPDRIVVHSDYGGHVKATKATYARLTATGKPLLIDGPVHSVGAFQSLAVPGACYTPNATVSLHAISYLGLVPSVKHTERATRRLPPPIAEWFRANMAFYDPIGFAVLGGEELSEVWPEGRC